MRGGDPIRNSVSEQRGFSCYTAIGLLGALGTGVGEFSDYGVTELDVAKRLIDHAIHPPTMSWPGGAPTRRSCWATAANTSAPTCRTT